MNDIQDFQEAMQPKRSDLLRTLCILSFLGCGLVVLMSLVSLPTLLTSQEELLLEVDKLSKVSPDKAEIMYQTVTQQDFKTTMLFSMVKEIAFACLTFFAVLQMWKRKKIGFNLYILAEIGAYIATLAINKGDLFGPGTNNKLTDGLIQSAFILILMFDLLFIILYATCRKEMN